MDDSRYAIYSQMREKEFESICTRCGECCGASDDPCTNLVRLEKDKYICKAYNSRFGSQKTISGNPFTCVPIRDHIKNDTLRANCAYRKLRN